MRRVVRDAAAAPGADTGDADGEFGTDRGGEAEAEVEDDVDDDVDDDDEDGVDDDVEDDAGEVDPGVPPSAIYSELQRRDRSSHSRGRFKGDRVVTTSGVDDILLCDSDNWIV